MNDLSLTVYGVRRYPAEPDFHSCEDVSLVTNPETLRKLAIFLLQCADSMEELKPNESDGWHMHLRDHLDGWTEDMVDVIVSK